MNTANHDIKLSESLKKKYIALSLKGASKKEVLTELVELVAESNKLKDKKEFLKVVLERERLGSTGIGNGVAIPHAKSNVVKSFILAFGRAERGIDFGALDGEKTYLFFILASPREEVGRHLKVMSKISRLISDKFIVESLKRAKTSDEILKIISLQDK
ncbi:MAG: PTS sugar transporter subunit IIA [Candidatus Omnitrophota bacterium]